MCGDLSTGRIRAQGPSLVKRRDRWQGQGVFCALNVDSGNGNIELPDERRDVGQNGFVIGALGLCKAMDIHGEMPHVELVGDGSLDTVLEEIEGGFGTGVETGIVLSKHEEKRAHERTIRGATAFDAKIGFKVFDWIGNGRERREIGGIGLDGEDGFPVGIKFFPNEAVSVVFQKIAKPLPFGVEGPFHFGWSPGAVELVGLEELVKVGGNAEDFPAEGVDGEEDVGFSGTVCAEEGEDGDAAEFGARSRQERKAGLGGMPVRGFPFGERKVDGFVENRPEVFDMDGLNHGETASLSAPSIRQDRRGVNDNKQKFCLYLHFPGGCYEPWN